MVGSTMSIATVQTRVFRLVRAFFRCTFLFLFPLLVLTVGGVGILAILTRSISTVNDPLWVKTACTVVYSRIAFTYVPELRTSLHIPQVMLSYRVGDQVIKTVCRSTPSRYYSPGDESRWMSRYPEGRTVWCYVNSADPSRVQLERNYVQAILPNILPLSLISVILVFAVRVIRNYLRPEQRRERDAAELPVWPAWW